MTLGEYVDTPSDILEIPDRTRIKAIFLFVSQRSLEIILQAKIYISAKTQEGFQAQHIHTIPQDTVKPLHEVH